MNKTLLIASTVAAFLFASCDNENTTNPEPTGTVTIKGVVVSDLDEDDDIDEPSLEKVPAGVALYFISEDGALLATGTTTADGYTQELTISKPQEITIEVGDFTTNVNKFDGIDDFQSKPAVYNDRQHFFVDVQKGGAYIQNLEINQPTLTDF
jgi:hypothetical protein